MIGKQDMAPDSTAARVALWRALHVEIDPPPHVLEDGIGLKLLAPDKDWHRRGDMDRQFTRPFRASIVARARFIEDLVVEQASRGLSQYVIFGAGLDSFVQRKPEVASGVRVFEIDRPGPQAWKRQRLIELGFGVPDWLRFVPVDFEAGASWRDGLVSAGFDDSKPAIVASTGVSMYLTKGANAATLRQVAALAPGSTLAMTFLLPLELADPEIRPALEMAEKGARASGTPFLSFFTPPEIMALARQAGLEKHGMFRRQILSSATSRAGQVASRSTHGVQCCAFLPSLCAFQLGLSAISKSPPWDGTMWSLERGADREWLTLVPKRARKSGLEFYRRHNQKTIFCCRPAAGAAAGDLRCNQRLWLARLRWRQSGQ